MTAALPPSNRDRTPRLDSTRLTGSSLIGEMGGPVGLWGTSRLDDGLCPTRSLMTKQSLCPNIRCYTSANTPKYDTVCEARDVVVDVANNHIYANQCTEGSYAYTDRFGKAIRVNHRRKDHLGASPSCNVHQKNMVYFPAGMLDEWNPYEGLHQHTAAYISAVGFGFPLNKSAVAFHGAVPTSRGFPLKGLWKMTFTAMWSNRETVCVDRLLVPVSAERSLNTFHQPTCNDRLLLDGYRRWIASKLSARPPCDCVSVLVIKRAKHLRRHERNIDALVQGLNEVGSLDGPGPARRLCARTIIPHQLEIPEQLEAVHSSHIMIGTHGAALTWLVALRRGGHVVELGASQPHYRHWATALNISYTVVEMGIAWGTGSYSIEIPKVVSAVAGLARSREKTSLVQNCGRPEKIKK